MLSTRISSGNTAARNAARLAPVLLASALLAACAGRAPQAAQQPAPQPPPRQDGCDAAAAQFAVGQAYNTPLAEQARQRSGSASVRALRPNQAVTMEFNAQRLNLDLDAGERVTRVRCG